MGAEPNFVPKASKFGSNSSRFFGNFWKLDAQKEDQKVLALWESICSPPYCCGGGGERGAEQKKRGLGFTLFFPASTLCSGCNS